MDPSRFDAITKLFASRRSRRAAITSGIGMAAAPFVRASAQDATPVASPAGDVNDPHPRADVAADPEFLFVQAFDSGTWAPKAGEADVYTLTLSGAAASTVYFSDRPERIVGLSPTQTFLDGLGFTPDNPPNAALVSRTPAGEREILIIELLNPHYDAAEGTLTYDARVLADYGEPGLGHLARQQTDYALPEQFGVGSLFIDDCPMYTYDCTLKGTVVGQVQVRGRYDEFGCECCTLPNSNIDYNCWQAYPDQCADYACVAERE